MYRFNLTLRERIERHLYYDPNTGCWLWTRATRNGYGVLGYEKKTFYVHRESYRIFNGQLKEGLFVCHHCDTRVCCNPDHLFLGTQKDNMVDMCKKDRRSSILKNKDVEKIITLLGSMSIVAIARLYKVTPGAIRHIAKGRSWKIITGL